MHTCACYTFHSVLLLVSRYALLQSLLHLANLIEPVFQQVVFAALIVAVLAKAGWQMRLFHLDAKSKEKSIPSIFEAIRWMALVSVPLLIAGFIIWVIDTKKCDDLRAIRRYLGLPWGVLLELHGWWSVSLV